MNIKKIMPAAALALCLGVMTGCGGKSGSTVTLAGSTAFQPFAEELAELYMSQHPDVRITVQGGGSTVGIQSAREGAADIGMADMLTLPPDVAGVLDSTVVARDGIAIIVHPDNKVANLTMEQARAVFCGAVKTWKDLGGSDCPVNVLSREEGSGTRKSFEQLILKGTKLTPAAMFQDSNGTIREAVATNPQAVGYISIGLLNDSVRAVKLGGVTPDNVNVTAGKYPLSRPVFFLTKGEPPEAARGFIEFVLSPEGQELIREKGLVPAGKAASS